MNQNLAKLIQKINVSRIIMDNVAGKNHSIQHRKLCGVAVMLFGMALIQVLNVLPHYLHFVSEGIGAAIHGMGLIPFVEERE